MSRNLWSQFTVLRHFGDGDGSAAVSSENDSAEYTESDWQQDKRPAAAAASLETAYSFAAGCGGGGSW